MAPLLGPFYSRSDALSLPHQDLPVLQRASAAWQQLCTRGPQPAPTSATRHRGEAPKGVANSSYDVVVLGGTLGLLLATALLTQQQQHQQTRGLQVAVVERGRLQGRQQEWNITHSDLQVLVELGVLSPGELQSVVASRFSSVRVGVAGVAEVRLQGVMDCG
eukprot:gene3056-3337_t